MGGPHSHQLEHGHYQSLGMRPRLASSVEEEGCLRLAAFASRLRLSLQRVLDLSIVGEGMAG